MAKGKQNNAYDFIFTVEPDDCGRGTLNIRPKEGKWSHFSGTICIPPTVAFRGIEYPVSIQRSTFDYLVKPFSVRLPAEPVHFVDNPFVSCKLRAIEVDPLNPDYTAVDGALYDKAVSRLIACPGAVSSSYVFPSTVTEIGKYAFHGAKFRRLVLPATIARVYGFAFEYSKLRSVFLPSSVCKIDPWAFEYCYRLRKIVYCSATQLEQYSLPTMYGWEKHPVRMMAYAPEQEAKVGARYGVKKKTGERRPRRNPFASVGGLMSDAFGYIADNIVNIGKGIAAIAFVGFAVLMLVDKFKPKPEYEIKVPQYYHETSTSTDAPGKQTSTPVADTYVGGTYAPTYVGSDETSSQNDNSHWESYYRNQYAEMERQAERDYNSLTNLGARYDNNGKADGFSGRNDPYVASQVADFNQLKSRMRNLRNEAAQKGVDISRSSWEDANVNI